MREPVTEGEKKANEALRLRPLLPIESDRRLAREFAEIAERRYPAGWIRRSNGRTELLVTSWFPVEGSAAAVLSPVALSLWGNGLAVSLVAAAVASLVVVMCLRKSGAGYYVNRGGGIEGDERAANIVHELGHRMQDVVPGLVERERTFLEKKTGRHFRAYPPLVAACGRLMRGLWEAGLRLLRREADDSHGLYHRYAAFNPLDGRTFEVFTMGYQGLRYGAKDPRTGKFEPGMKPYADHRGLVERPLREL